ncbi:hypothetical protein OUZ56_033136 [Daphnia magna]|uniref:Uncharacterized protein n=1 Tax=Daphnia magna TaxID=35525 RepID=A0ABR0BAA9_9CRUS|nr:hypothetical protein OUZ56_033136 [Daphnia magna]
MPTTETDRRQRRRLRGSPLPIHAQKESLFRIIALIDRRTEVGRHLLQRGRLFRVGARVGDVERLIVDGTRRENRRRHRRRARPQAIPDRFVGLNGASRRGVPRLLLVGRFRHEGRCGERLHADVEAPRETPGTTNAIVDRTTNADVRPPPKGDLAARVVGACSLQQTFMAKALEVIDFDETPEKARCLGDNDRDKVELRLEPAPGLRMIGRKHRGCASNRIRGDAVKRFLSYLHRPGKRTPIACILQQSAFFFRPASRRTTRGLLATTEGRDDEPDRGDEGPEAGARRSRRHCAAEAAPFEGRPVIGGAGGETGAERLPDVGTDERIGAAAGGGRIDLAAVDALAAAHRGVAHTSALAVTAVGVAFAGRGAAGPVGAARRLAFRGGCTDFSIKLSALFVAVAGAGEALVRGAAGVEIRLLREAGGIAGARLVAVAPCVAFIVGRTANTAPTVADRRAALGIAGAGLADRLAALLVVETDRRAAGRGGRAGRAVFEAAAVVNGLTGLRETDQRGRIRLANPSDPRRDMLRVDRDRVAIRNRRLALAGRHVAPAVLAVAVGHTSIRADTGAALAAEARAANGRRVPGRTSRLAVTEPAEAVDDRADGRFADGAPDARRAGAVELGSAGSRLAIGRRLEPGIAPPLATFGSQAPVPVLQNALLLHSASFLQPRQLPAPAPATSQIGFVFTWQGWLAALPSLPLQAMQADIVELGGVGRQGRVRPLELLPLDDDLRLACERDELLRRPMPFSILGDRRDGIVHTIVGAKAGLTADQPMLNARSTRACRRIQTDEPVAVSLTANEHLHAVGRARLHGDEVLREEASSGPRERLTQVFARARRRVRRRRERRPLAIGEVREVDVRRLPSVRTVLPILFEDHVARKRFFQSVYSNRLLSGARDCEGRDASERENRANEFHRNTGATTNETAAGRGGPMCRRPTLGARIVGCRASWRTSAHRSKGNTGARRLRDVEFANVTRSLAVRAQECHVRAMDRVAPRTPAGAKRRHPALERPSVCPRLRPGGAPAAARARALELDLWEGQALLGFVPFKMEKIAPPLIPPALGLEFWRRTCGLTCITQTFWGLPYFHADMSFEAGDSLVTYESRRRHQHTHFRARARFGEVLATPEAPSAPTPLRLEYYLLERYLLFVARRGELHCGAVHQRPYPRRAVDLRGFYEYLTTAVGLSGVSAPICAHASSGVSVEVFSTFPVAKLPLQR